MSNIAWRRRAKNVLYGYYADIRYLKALEKDLIYAQGPHRDGRNRGRIADPTAVKSMLMEEGRLGELRREQKAVEKLLSELEKNRRDCRYKRGLLEMVYFRRSHSLYGAAAYLGIPERTAHRWNARMLQYLARELGYLVDEPDADRESSDDE